jgi:hypothetical protein
VKGVRERLIARDINIFLCPSVLVFPPRTE